MPASRSRTERWKDCLHQVYERSGTLEVTLPRPAGPGVALGGEGSNVVWRVRVMGLSETEIVVEAPMTLGRTIPLAPGVELIGAMTIGQNRWMFMTRVLGPVEIAATPRPLRAIRLVMPEKVERCTRRAAFRISTAEVTLPPVEAWPLLDPASVVAAETANRLAARDEDRGAGSPPTGEESLLLPEVGPKFHARLMNLGGGGAGLIVDRRDAAAVDRARTYWLRIDLRPHVRVPVALSAKLAHTHIDSEQNVYVGLAFDFTFNPSHREYVVDQICRYAATLQGAQRHAA